MGKTRKEIHEDYDAFVEKFKPKKTTDDCYTPQPVYDEIVRWVNDRIMPLEGVEIVRPFWPGGNYETHDYPPGAVVIDNPPFSMLAKIRRFYETRGIKYFLFAPSLTLFNSARDLPNSTYIVAACRIVYENGAVVRTSFVTNMLNGDPLVMLAGDLFKRVDKVVKEMSVTRSTAKLLYPDCVISSALLGRLAERGICLDFSACDLHAVSKLDNYPAGVYGGGFLLSAKATAERAAAERAAAERAAAERAAAERAAAERVRLSPRELEIINNLGQ